MASTSPEPFCVEANLYFVGPRQSGKSLLGYSLQRDTVPKELTPSLLSLLSPTDPPTPSERAERYFGKFTPPVSLPPLRSSALRFIVFDYLHEPPSNDTSPVQQQEQQQPSPSVPSPPALPPLNAHLQEQTQDQLIRDSLERHEEWEINHAFLNWPGGSLFVRPSVVLICFDISCDRRSFQKLIAFYAHNQVQSMWRDGPPRNVDFWLIGCKSDLRDNNDHTGNTPTEGDHPGGDHRPSALLSIKEAQLAAKQAGFMGYREVSALKDLESVQAMMRDVALQARVRVAEELGRQTRNCGGFDDPFTAWWKKQKLERQKKKILGK